MSIKSIMHLIFNKMFYFKRGKVEIGIKTQIIPKLFFKTTYNP